MMRKILLPLLCLLVSALAVAQGYQGLHGSAYTGSTAIFNNPAASITSAYQWDLTLFSVQGKLSTNSLYLKNFTLTNRANTEITILDKYHSRFYHGNADASVFNFQYKLNNRQAFAVGVRVRSYAHGKSLPFFWADTTSGLRSFLLQNANTPYLDGFATSSSWAEGYLNYAQVLFENDHARLSGGITLQIMKGLGGAHVRMSKLSYLLSKVSNDTIFTFTGGTGVAAYSDNFNATDGSDYLKRSGSGLGLSLGIEYMTYNSENNFYGNNNLNYDWKIGVSLMDLGASSYQPGVGSGSYYNPKSNFTDADAERKFNGAQNVTDLRDSLKTMFGSSTDLVSRFSISNPTRLIINVDKNIGNHFYLNGELSLNFYSSAGYGKIRTRELNLLTVTPRWETIGLGVFMPVQYNTQGQLWVGAAAKLGPLTAGFHNIGFLLQKDPLVNGGGYLLLSIHPFSRKKILSKMDCYE